jgi:hypothetical protein
VKASENDRIRLLVDVSSEVRDRVIPRGTEGAIIEGYDDPEEYAVDFPVHDTNVVGERTWENVIVYPDQFEVVGRYGDGQ